MTAIKILGAAALGIATYLAIRKSAQNNTAETLAISEPSATSTATLEQPIERAEDFETINGKPASDVVNESVFEAMNGFPQLVFGRPCTFTKTGGCGVTPQLPSGVFTR